MKRVGGKLDLIRNDERGWSFVSRCVTGEGAMVTKTEKLAICNV